MPLVSLVCRVDRPTSRWLTHLYEMLTAQTESDWELHVVVGSSNQRHYQILTEVLGGLARVYLHQRSSQESLPAMLNDMRPLFGNWVGMIGVSDLLVPHALSSMLAAATPETKVIYSDEEAYDLLGTVTLRTAKGPLNPYRLRSQEYLGNLTLIQTAWLNFLKGFSLTSTEWPAHAVYLRTLELLGPEAFTYVPARLYRKFRRYTDPVVDRRRMPWLAGFDLEAIRQFLQRNNISAGTVSLRGFLRTDYHLPRTPLMTVYVVLTNNSERNVDIIRSVLSHLEYRAALIEIVFTGNNRIAEQAAREEVQGFGWRFHVTPDLVQFLNQEVPRSRGAYVGIVQGEVFSRDWDECLLALALQKDVGAAGGRVLEGRFLALPGTLGFRFKGWDWNTRGPFGQLAVITNTVGLSGVNIVFGVHTFIDIGGLDSSMGSLVWMDFCTQLHMAGLQVLYHPGVLVGAEPSSDPAPEDKLAFLTKHPTWSDPWDYFSAT